MRTTARKTLLLLMYSKTPRVCPDGEPADTCSGLKLRGTTRADPAKGESWNVWESSPRSKQRGTDSYSYIRDDINFSDLAVYTNNGYIVAPSAYLCAGQPITYTQCAFPKDGWTSDRTDRGCGDSPLTSMTETHCQNVGVNSGQAWWDQFRRNQTPDGAWVPQPYQMQCSFDMSKARGKAGRAKAFADFIDAHKLATGREFLMANELLISNDQPPNITAFMYTDIAGRADALKNQADYLRVTGNYRPVVQVVLPKFEGGKTQFLCDGQQMAFPGYSKSPGFCVPGKAPTPGFGVQPGSPVVSPAQSAAQAAQAAQQAAQAAQQAAQIAQALQAAQGSGQTPQSSGQTPQSSGQTPQSSGQTPQSSGKIPPSPQSSGQVPQSSGQSQQQIAAQAAAQAAAAAQSAAAASQAAQTAAQSAQAVQAVAASQGGQMSQAQQAAFAASQAQAAQNALAAQIAAAQAQAAAAAAAQAQTEAGYCRKYIESATWVQRNEPGYGLIWTLQVKPTECARRMGPDQTDRAYRELYEMFKHDPRWTENLNPGSMRRQFVCHVVGTPNKETWNLEPARPYVSHQTAMSLPYICNPQPSDAGK